MAELENILESVMSSPGSMEKIMDIVKMFGGGDTQKEEAPLAQIKNIGNSNGIDPALISKITDIVGNYSDNGDRRIQLLSAVRPYIKEEDWYHIDRAIQIVKLSHVAKGVLHDFLK